MNAPLPSGAIADFTCRRSSTDATGTALGFRDLLLFHRTNEQKRQCSEGDHPHERLFDRMVVTFSLRRTSLIARNVTDARRAALCRRPRANRPPAGLKTMF